LDRRRTVVVGGSGGVLDARAPRRSRRPGACAAVRVVQLVRRWPNPDGHEANDLPLDGRGQSNPQTLFESFQPVQGKPTAVTEYRDHARHRRIVLLLARAFMSSTT